MMSSTDSPLSSLMSGGYQEIAMTPENEKKELVEIALAKIYHRHYEHSLVVCVGLIPMAAVRSCCIWASTTAGSREL